MNYRLFVVSVLLQALLVAGVLLVRGCTPVEPGIPVPPTVTATTTATAVPASPTPSPTSSPELPTSTAVPPSPTGTPSPTSTATAVIPSPTPTVTLSPVPDPPYATHRIEAGDTYWEQARQWYGNPYCWPSLEEANGWNRFRLPIGAYMKLPAGCLKVVER